MSNIAQFQPNLSNLRECKYRTNISYLPQSSFMPRTTERRVQLSNISPQIRLLKQCNLRQFLSQLLLLRCDVFNKSCPYIYFPVLFSSRPTLLYLLGSLSPPLILKVRHSTPNNPRLSLIACPYQDIRSLETLCFLCFIIIFSHFLILSSYLIVGFDKSIVYSFLLSSFIFFLRSSLSVFFTIFSLQYSLICFSFASTLPFRSPSLYGVVFFILCYSIYAILLFVAILCFLPKATLNVGEVLLHTKLFYSHHIYSF